MLAFMLGQGTWVLAGTTGEITGTLIDANSGKPLGGAQISAVSPSQSVKTRTDGQGRFSFLSLAPDTYAVGVDLSGYQGTTLNGVTVQADQTQTLALTVKPTFTQIGHVSSRAAADVIKPGQTADVYSVSAAQAAAAAPFGGGGSLNQAYSAIASVPGVTVPIGQQGWAQAVYVRGGNYTQLGYEYDGVPVQRAYDAYPSSTLSALGSQETQVYTGSQPASAQSSGLAGFVNQVIKTGTYPGTATGDLGLGTPTFYHKAQLELGGASPDRNFSYYLAAGGYDQSTRFVDQFDGASATFDYSSVPFARLALAGGACATGVNVPVGCYQNGFGSGPNGYLWAPINWGSTQDIGDRETVANLHFGIPHKNDGLKDDIQVLGSISYLFQSYSDSYNSWGPGQAQLASTGMVSYHGQTYPACTGGLAVGQPCALDFLSGPGAYNLNTSIYTGPTGGALTAANLGQVNPYPFPFSPSGQLGNGTINPTTDGAERINDGIFKLQYTHAMGDNAYVRAYGYSLYSDWLNNEPNANYAFDYVVPLDYILPTHTRGFGVTLADQVGNHLFNLTGGYSTADLSRWNNGFPGSGPVAVLVNSANPAAGCYSTGHGAPAAAPCSGADSYGVNGNYAAPGLTVNSPGGLTVNNVGGATCGSGPCEYLAVGSGLNGSFNNVSPHFSNLALTDSWSVTPALTVDLGVRYDSFMYAVPSSTLPEGPNPAGTASTLGRQLFTNSYDQWNCFDKTTDKIVGATSAGICPAGSSLVNFSNDNATSFWFGGFQPRIGATYKLDPLNVFRTSYGRFLQPTSTAYTFYNRAGADIAGYDAPNFYPYGYATATHELPPEESNNFDFSWEHQVKGSDISWKLTPFVRTTRNEDITVILNPVTNFASAIPALSSNIHGIEALFRKGDFSRNGFAAQIAYTYTSEQSKYQTLPGGSTALDNVNAAVKTYNGYTSFCAANPGDKRCGLPSNGLTASPCYTSGANVPDPTCAAGDIANPYWNAPVQPLFNPNANYYPYNQTFSSGFSSNASSYNIPHVAAIILNYKHDKWAFTPTFQVSAGGRYGSPTMGLGVDPAGGGCTALTGLSTTGDPRYPYGAAGGSPYAAQNCGPAYLTAIPDPYTGKFDTPGQFVEPTQVVANLGITYAATKRLTFSLLGVNLFGTCFGGSKQAWTNAGPKIGCWYGSASGWQAGNFYNPGDMLTTQSLPYFPVAGQINGQQVYGTAVNPLQVFLSAQYKL
jgi:hypothetical protein